MNRKIGYTTGVFDMFHIGHLNLLERARLQCDFLIVGVTTDDLVIARKNNSPIIPFEERFKIVESIRFVDRVLPQSTMNKMDAWSKIQFDMMFVGDDWRNSAIWDNIEKQFSSLPVQIIYLPYTTHTSSTILRKTLEYLHSCKGGD